MPDIVTAFLPHLLTALALGIDVTAACHAVIYKRDTRAAIAWVGFIWFVPFFGGLLYLWLGVNRIRRRATARRHSRELLPQRSVEYGVDHDAGAMCDLGGRWTHLSKLVGDLTRNPLLSDNRVEPLRACEALSRMLEAVKQARRSVTLTTYIFDRDAAGLAFADALAEAVARKVEVRVIIDSVGAKYSWPSILRRLKKARVPVATFMPKLTPWAFPYANLCNHRKILVVDGKLGYTGGMNIREGYLTTRDHGATIEDLHFEVEGPVVAQLQHAFGEDWVFCTHETLDGDLWFPSLEPSGTVLARGVPDGPDEDLGNLRTTVLGALACASSTVQIITPYFLPDAGLITALNLASMRGVRVDILLPEICNLRLVQWASMAMLWQVLERGCRVWLTPPPFDHSKLMVVDGVWTLLGSSNWDPRSMRLNFEFNLECYDAALAAQLETMLETKRRLSKPLTLEEVDSRSFPRRLRDGTARLLTPYL